MRSKLLAVLVTAVLSIAGCNVQAQSGKTATVNVFESGLWICGSPIGINNLRGKMRDTSNSGVKLTFTIIGQMAETENGDCKRLDADNIKPIASAESSSLDAGWSIIRVSDGKQAGWTDIDMYIAYMQFHVVRRAESK